MHFLCYNKKGDKMKAITIKEPCASLIINGHKKYEFRTWKTNYRGKVLIHTSINPDTKNLKRFENYNLDYGKGEIIGEAEITDCIKVDEKFMQKLRNNEVYKTSGLAGGYAFKLENVKKYKKRIPYKGKLGFWDYKI